MEQSRALIAELSIEHMGESAPATFKLTRLSDGKSLMPVAISSPYQFPVENQLNSNLMRELRWCLEHFLDYPFHPETLHADHVLEALQTWGAQAFDALFDRRDAGNWLAACSALQVRSDDPNVLSWPWEALFDPQSGSYLAHQRRMERCLNNLPDPAPNTFFPRDRVNILLVVARPYEGDVGYRSIARPLIELIQEQNLPAYVDVLRPPTFDQLREHLRTHPRYYHVLHFDGHGAYSEGRGGYSPHQFRGRQGYLVFENENGEEDPKSASDLSVLLREYAVPAVVLNACQSATLDHESEHAFATVATALLQSGVRSVVAMAYSLYVSGAQIFLPAFYHRLFEKGSVSEATRAGRQQMLAHKERISARGPYPLQDWVLPVLYQQSPLEFKFATRAKLVARKSCLPREVRSHRDEYGFIGRDGPILEMERALHREASCVLVQGLSGVGKTTLARGFLRWLDETGGLDAAIWLDFCDIRTSDYVVNKTGLKLYGEKFLIATNKLELIASTFKRQRVIMVWDNFEASAENLTAKDRSDLGALLDAIRGTRGKVIIASRSDEEWLGSSRRVKLLLRGFEGEERWEYCGAILRELGLKVNRDDAELITLVNLLAGHPLALRSVLPKLEKMPAAKVIDALHNNIADLKLRGNDEGRLFATLRFVEEGLPLDLQPMLGLVGLHEACLSAAAFEIMIQRSDLSCTRQQIDQLLAALVNAGLVREIGSEIFTLHPLLTTYLRSTVPVQESCELAFVQVLAEFASILAPQQPHEKHNALLVMRANFHAALHLSKKLAMRKQSVALTQCLAIHALNSRNFLEASRLFVALNYDAAEHEDWYLEAACYHNVGLIAQEQRQFEPARAWYRKSLAVSEPQGALKCAAETYYQLGLISHDEREFDMAEKWYRTSLAIKEEQKNQRGIAQIYHQLGRLAEQEQDFDRALKRYKRTLDISEKTGDQQQAASTYHQIGVIFEKRNDVKSARGWYRKSLAIKEKQRNLYGVAVTSHQLGRIASAEGDLATARTLYLRSLDISEKQGYLQVAAGTYNELGGVAVKTGDLELAREWYLKSHNIFERESNLHGMASAYGSLGLLEALQDRPEQSARWLIKSVTIFRSIDDKNLAELGVTNLLLVFNQASQEDQQKLKIIWQEANLGPFPTQSQ